MAKEKTNEKANQNDNETLLFGKEQEQKYSEQPDIAVNHKYKDTLFRFIFNDRERLLGLYINEIQGRGRNDKYNRI